MNDIYNLYTLEKLKEINKTKPPTKKVRIELSQN